jgi:hypothetical protein
MFFYPGISRIEKIFPKNCPKISNFYASNLNRNNKGPLLPFPADIVYTAMRKAAALEPVYN